MASAIQVNNFFKTIGPLVIKVCKERGYGDIQAYTCICQAACESAYGTSGIMVNANAYFGIKATQSWVDAAKYGGKVYNSATKECYDGKTYQSINACFRAYNNMEDSIRDYFDLIEKDRYKNSLKATSVEECITIIKNGGYATSPTYINTITNIFNTYKSDITKFSVKEVNTMTNKEFVEKLIKVLDYKTLYVMGCFGAPLNDTNKARYTKNHSYNMKKERVSMINAADSDTFGFDCVCLIKAILWGWNGDTTKVYGGAKYLNNSVPDVSADAIGQRYLKDASSSFLNIEVGEAVWMPGHIGVYIGDGKVIESSPKWQNGVQITYVANMGYDVGPVRTWTKHGKLPWVTYVTETETSEPKPVISDIIGTREYKVTSGDTLSKIAARYGTTVDKIVEDNKDKYSRITRNFIVTGWVLKV